MSFADTALDSQMTSRFKASNQGLRISNRASHPRGDGLQPRPGKALIPVNESADDIRKAE
jgi:hypothetical protein